MTAPTPYLSASDLAAARGTHYIEEAVRVYLMRDLDGENTWVIDPSTFGEGLYSDYEDPVNVECQCERPDECEAVAAQMSRVDLPDGKELMHMLAAALGYTATKNDPS
ncbi:MAG: hypothetical protein WAW17_16925 [Rhodococcus sp. (in: high G+C Gram-positive bacteria)]|uniref:hypothetical protein n=1 Tax=Rhodococcus sp. TaxID=1831 RepID=UPI003BAF310B